MIAHATLLFALVCGALAAPAAPLRSPAETAALVAYQLAQNQNAFFIWDYGGALVFDGIYQAASEPDFDMANYTTLLDHYLDAWAADPSAYGYKVLHNITVPFGGAIGDSIGLFPIAYLNRYQGRVNSSHTDLQIAVSVLEKYVLGWPTHLPDGSISRNSSWPGQQGKGTFIWGDDAFMGITLAARLAVFLGREDLATFAASQALLLSGHLVTDDGVYSHGYNDADHDHSCCKWGRANGWTMMSHVEALESVSAFPSLQDQKRALQQRLVQHASALIASQGPDGRWHQLINDTTTFLETSCTSMFLVTLARAHRHGWLDDSVVPAVHKAYGGLLTTIDDSGVVNGVCEGTGIQTTPDAYRTRSTDYLKSRAGGVGTVLTAMVEYQHFAQRLKLKGL